MYRCPNTLAIWCFAAFALQLMEHSGVSAADTTPGSNWRLIDNRNGRFIVRGQNQDPTVQPVDPSIPPLRRRGGQQISPERPSLQQQIEAELRSADSPRGTPLEQTSSAQAFIRAPSDAGGVVESAPSVSVQRRSPISLDPYMRGYRAGQIYAQAAGAQWLPVRRDLDSMLSRIDPSLIENAQILSGPYGLRYGPGLAFIDIATSQTPRYEEGYESYYRTGLTYRGNGNQTYFHETAYGGNADWGYIVSWGVRGGDDYQAGGNAPFSKIPSSYRAQNFLGQIGVDLTSDSNLEVRYQRFDNTDTEYAAQIFDINFMGTDAVSASYFSEDPCRCRTFQVDTWFNFTRFSGGVAQVNNGFPVVGKINRALDNFFAIPIGTSQFTGGTLGDLTSTGIRAVRTIGDPEQRMLRMGADLRYTEQKIVENLQIVGAPPPASTPFSTNMPRADLVDPGVFVELSLPVMPAVTSTLGGRLDYVHTRARPRELRGNTSINNGATNFAQNDNLYAFYLTTELELSPCWTLNVAGGHAQRSPSLVDRYADGVFLGIMQSGFNRVIGEPTLQKERAWQVDVTARAEYDAWNFRGNVFYSWIDNYNLYMGQNVVDPTGARLLRATNAELVTLAGCELNGDAQLTQTLSAFGTLRYLLGRDKGIAVAGQRVDQPLYGINPLEGQFGLRWTDYCGGEVWGIELGARMVSGQSKVARLRQGATTITGLVPLELPTSGFTTAYVRGYYNATESLNLVAGIDNLFDRSYIEHLNLRLPANQPAVPAPDPRNVFTQAFSPGITPYVGAEWTF